ncbi:MAG: hypothetical protein QNJ74_22960 [Trichodesmium sp. MO_231.B1]|nr:hypothetical protein [Trichodesmium sp. MO_231.B1]
MLIIPYSISPTPHPAKLPTLPISPNNSNKYSTGFELYLGLKPNYKQIALSSEEDGGNGQNYQKYG